MRSPVRLGLICPNDLAREGLRCILISKAFDVRAAAADVHGLKALVAADEVDVIIVDATEQDQEQAAELWHEAHDLFPSCRLAVTLRNFGIDSVVRAFAAGVDGVLIKDVSCDQLSSAINLVALGQRVLPSRVVDFLMDMHQPRSTNEWELSRTAVNLSDREIEILKCLVAGEANKLISRRLGITEATVKVHIKAILRKLHVMNRTQAAIWAVVRGLNRIEKITDRPVDRAASD